MTDTQEEASKIQEVMLEESSPTRVGFEKLGFTMKQWTLLRSQLRMPMHLDAVLTQWHNDYISHEATTTDSAQGQMIHAMFSVPKELCMAWFTLKNWSTDMVASYRDMTGRDRLKVARHDNFWFDWSKTTNVLPLYILDVHRSEDEITMSCDFQEVIDLVDLIKGAKGAMIWALEGGIWIAPTKDLLTRVAKHGTIRMQQKRNGLTGLSWKESPKNIEVYRLPSSGDIGRYLRRELVVMWQDDSLTMDWINARSMIRAAELRLHEVNNKNGTKAHGDDVYQNSEEEREDSFE